MVLDSGGNVCGSTVGGGTGSYGSVYEASTNVFKEALVGGNNQSGTVATSLAASLVVQVTDGQGNPVAGVTVNWAVAGSNGSVGAATSTTDPNGDASIGATLGTTASRHNSDAFTAIKGRQVPGSERVKT